jgi:hypothetical protein
MLELGAQASRASLMALLTPMLMSMPIPLPFLPLQR